MKTLLQSLGLLVILHLILTAPAAAAYYDENGVKIEKDRFKQIVQMRAADINKINKDGYGEPSIRMEDPVRLRNKRIDQWKLQQKKGRGR